MQPALHVIATLVLVPYLLLALAGGALLVIVIVPGTMPDAGNLLFLLPCALAVACGAWVALSTP